MDACKLMGYRTYYDQVIYDQLEHQTYKVTDTVDVATFKDYIQVSIKYMAGGYTNSTCCMQTKK